jgi:predicted transcriptional regulator
MKIPDDVIERLRSLIHSEEELDEILDSLMKQGLIRLKKDGRYVATEKGNRKNLRNQGFVP